LPPRRSLLDPWLPAKGAAMIYAPRGLGKTYLALSIAHIVASGGTLLGWLAPTPRRVLCLDGEMPMDGLQERLRGIAAASAEKPPSDDFLRFLPADHFRDGLPDLATWEGRALLEAMTQDVDLVVLDNLSTLASGKENEADAWQPMQDLVLSLRRRGVTTLMIHHAGKGGAQRGTSRREDILDTVMALRRPGDYCPADGARFEVHFEKSRGFAGADAAPFEARLTTDAQTNALLWHRSSLRPDAKAVAMAMLASGRSATETAKELNVDRSTVFRWQKESRQSNGDVH